MLGTPSKPMAEWAGVKGGCTSPKDWAGSKPGVPGKGLSAQGWKEPSGTMAGLSGTGTGRLTFSDSGCGCSISASARTVSARSFSSSASASASASIAACSLRIFCWAANSSCCRANSSCRLRYAFSLFSSGAFLFGALFFWAVDVSLLLVEATSNIFQLEVILPLVDTGKSNKQLIGTKSVGF